MFITRLNVDVCIFFKTLRSDRRDYYLGSANTLSVVMEHEANFRHSFFGGKLVLSLLFHSCYLSR